MQEGFDDCLYESGGVFAKYSEVFVFVHVPSGKFRVIRSEKKSPNELTSKFSAIFFNRIEHDLEYRNIYKSRTRCSRKEFAFFYAVIANTAVLTERFEVLRIAEIPQNEPLPATREE